MIELSWPPFVAGVLAGAGVCVLYLAGLALGIRIALRRTAPAALLLCSTAIRIALLLAAGFAIARFGTFALVGFAGGFVLTRVIVVAALRPRAPGQTLPCR